MSRAGVTCRYKMGLGFRDFEDNFKLTLLFFREMGLGDYTLVHLP